MLKIHVASTFFLQSDPKGTFLPNFMFVSPFERFYQKITLICSTSTHYSNNNSNIATSFATTSTATTNTITIATITTSISTSNKLLVLLNYYNHWQHRTYVIHFSFEESLCFIFRHSNANLHWTHDVAHMS